MRHSQNFGKIDSFQKPVLNICVLGNLTVGWGEWVIKEGVAFCIKSIDLVEVLLFRGVGFIKVRVGIIKDRLENLRWDFFQKLFSAKSR